MRYSTPHLLQLSTPVANSLSLAHRSVLQCVAACCRVLQYVAVCCSELKTLQSVCLKHNALPLKRNAQSLSLCNNTLQHTLQHTATTNCTNTLHHNLPPLKHLALSLYNSLSLPFRCITKNPLSSKSKPPNPDFGSKEYLNAYTHAKIYCFLFVYRLPSHRVFSPTIQIQNTPYKFKTH